MTQLETDFVIVGSGPGGASVARELSAAGRRTLVLEKGRRHRIRKSRLPSVRMYDKWGIFSRSEEGVIIDRAITLGGCSVVFNGNAFDPPAWVQADLGIDLGRLSQEIRREIGIRPFSEGFAKDWGGIRRLREGAASLGIDLEPQPKFIQEDLCRNDCDDCMAGCFRNAKWTARQWVDEAERNGANVVTEADVRSIVIEGGRATGVQCSTPRGDLNVRAGTVVVSAGGIGTAVLLQRSGIGEAGGNFYMDPMNVLWGMADEAIHDRMEVTFSHAYTQAVDDRGFLIGNVSGKYAWVSQLLRPGIGMRILPFLGRWDRMVGLFVKFADSAGGRVYPDGRLSKPLDREDLGRAHEGTELARKILVRAGVRPERISIVERVGGHPGGTAAVGTVLDPDLRVRSVKNLYVCDASVFPRSHGRPPTLMSLALGRHFGRNLASL